MDLNAKHPCDDIYLYLLKLGGVRVLSCTYLPNISHAHHGPVKLWVDRDE